jgi:ergothioneine biosynthesis protein EgtB
LRATLIEILLSLREHFLMEVRTTMVTNDPMTKRRTQHQAVHREELLSTYASVRRMTEHLCKPLATEDYVIQSMPDVSPPKWHLAHTTWFFERVILQEHMKQYRPYNEKFYYLFNSYYQSFGERWRRDVRGVLSRPTVKEVYEYRAAIDQRMKDLIERVEESVSEQVAELTTLGLHHEQQHQELLVTDIKHILANNPLQPVYAARKVRDGMRVKPDARMLGFEGAIVEIGADEEGFSWDNERPRHKTLLEDFSLMNRLTTCGEYMEFMKDGGYKNPLLWLSDGWEVGQLNGWESPLYWMNIDGEWHMMTLHGLHPVDPLEPVCHVSYYEAAAFAAWAGKRLPSEEEWERASGIVRTAPSVGNFLESDVLHPLPLGEAPGFAEETLLQMFGDVWEWTRSAYLPYPGYCQEAGPLGEYNGKFMNNQMVLRGGSCATPQMHIRATYRNFFQGDKRWQFTGIRLASDGV